MQTFLHATETAATPWPAASLGDAIAAGKPVAAVLA